MSTSAAAMGMLGAGISAATGVGCCSCACISGVAAASAGGVTVAGAAFSGANGRTGSTVGSDESATGRFPLTGIASDVHRPSCQDEMASVTTNAMLVSPHIRKRWFMVVPGRAARVSLPKASMLVADYDGFCIWLPELHRGGRVGT